MDPNVLAPPGAPPCDDLPRPKHVLPPRLPEPRRHHVQRPQPDQNAVGGALLLPDHEKETIVVANVLPFLAPGGGAGHGGNSAHGRPGIPPFVLDEHQERRRGPRRDPLRPALLARGPSHHGGLLPLRPGGGHHPKVAPGGKSQRPPLHGGAVRRVAPSPPGILRHERRREADQGKGFLLGVERADLHPDTHEQRGRHTGGAGHQVRRDGPKGVRAYLRNPDIGRRPEPAGRGEDAEQGGGGGGGAGGRQPVDARDESVRATTDENDRVL
mmetsp:Transcript_41552/g.88536  ORF Transcript_41552/g.88536 Transcript_41552/m.88536 type:complete len:270 (-) Transcript_41552:314-1123(-)